ncbi:MAG: hypothetical protein ACPLSA_01750 [Caldanaerobacter sp.]
MENKNLVIIALDAVRCRNTARVEYLISLRTRREIKHREEREKKIYRVYPGRYMILSKSFYLSYVTGKWFTIQVDEKGNITRQSKIAIIEYDTDLKKKGLEHPLGVSPVEEIPQEIFDQILSMVEEGRSFLYHEGEIIETTERIPVASRMGMFTSTGEGTLWFDIEKKKFLIPYLGRVYLEKGKLYLVLSWFHQDAKGRAEEIDTVRVAFDRDGKKATWGAMYCTPLPQTSPLYQAVYNAAPRAYHGGMDKEPLRVTFSREDIYEVLNLIEEYEKENSHPRKWREEIAPSLEEARKILDRS